MPHKGYELALWDELSAIGASKTERCRFQMGGMAFLTLGVKIADFYIYDYWW